jgi:hypothetical protein
MTPDEREREKINIKHKKLNEKKKAKIRSDFLYKLLILIFNL